MPVDQPLVFGVISADMNAINRYGQAVGRAEPGAILLALAEALAANPRWATMPNATLIVRTGSTPRLGIVGKFDATATWRVQTLNNYLADLLNRLRFVSYAQAERDCEQLAAHLLARFGRDRLQDFRYVAIPRGGLIVLGMLAYHLGLQDHHLPSRQPPPPDAPLVVVDDCTLTGARFRRFLQKCTQAEIIFVTLYSHPQLRHAIESAEPRVSCISAQDLYDYGADGDGGEYHAWRTQWTRRAENAAECYWFGLVDHICFPWNEPDITVWNPITQEEEDGWYLLPPDLCLKNRTRANLTPLAVQIQPEGMGRLKLAAHLLFGELEGQIVIGNLATGQCFGLAGVAADMWRAILTCTDFDAAIGWLLAQYDVAEEQLRCDLAAFTNHLLAQTMLEQPDDATPYK